MAFVLGFVFGTLAPESKWASPMLANELCFFFVLRAAPARPAFVLCRLFPSAADAAGAAGAAGWSERFRDTAGVSATIA